MLQILNIVSDLQNCSVNNTVVNRRSIFYYDIWWPVSLLGHSAQKRDRILKNIAAAGWQHKTKQALMTTDMTLIQSQIQNLMPSADLMWWHFSLTHGLVI